MTEIFLVLSRHGFQHFLERMHLQHYLPPLLRRKLALPGARAGERPESLAERFALALQALGPVFVKFGQILSTRPDILPADFIAALERLQDHVDPEPADVTRRTFEHAFGAPPESVFREFSAAPIACGSIAQAHDARLADGADVVVKIKRHGIDATVREDMALLHWLAELAEKYLPELAPLQPRQLAREFENALERELDFTVEAAAAEKFAEQSKGNDRLVIPEVYWPYVRRDVLTLARAPGCNLSDPDWTACLAARAGRPPDRARVADTIAHAFMRQFFTTGFFHADPHPGNIFVVDDNRIALVDFGQTGRVPADMRRKMALVLAALSRNDPDFAAEIVADLGQAQTPGVLADFRAAFNDFVGRYFGMPADRMDFGEAVSGALAVARRHGLRLPRELALMIKSLVTVAGVVRKIDPAFRFDKAVEPYAREVLSARAWLRSLPHRGGRQAYRLLRLVAEAPEAVHELLDKTRRGQLRLVFQHEGLEARFDQAERAINRLAIGLIVAGITISSAIVLASGHSATLGSLGADGEIVRSIPLTVAVAGIGLTAATGIGLWVVWGVLRTPRRPPPHEDWTEDD